jgi:cysteine desulfurase/selenocysteine lyase
MVGSRGKPLVCAGQREPLIVTTSRHEPPVATETTERQHPHRAVHPILNGRAAAYEEARTKKLQRFINAPDERKVIFTSGTTEAIQPGDARLGLHDSSRPVTRLFYDHAGAPFQHHCAWQMLAETGAKIPRSAHQLMRADCAHSINSTAVERPDQSWSV